MAPSNSFLELVKEAALQTSMAEWIAVITAIIYVLLAARESILCWPFAFTSSAIYVYVFYGAQLYMETILNIFYVAMAVAGWVTWNQQGKENKIIRTSGKQLLILIAIGLAGTLTSGFIFDYYSDAALPYFDAATTSFSFIATWMIIKKMLENWIFWIVIDAASIILYSNRELYLSALLFLAYTFLAIYGFMQWKKELQHA